MSIATYIVLVFVIKLLNADCRPHLPGLYQSYIVVCVQGLYSQKCILYRIYVNSGTKFQPTTFHSSDWILVMAFSSVIVPLENIFKLKLYFTISRLSTFG